MLFSFGIGMFLFGIIWIYDISSWIYVIIWCMAWCMYRCTIIYIMCITAPSYITCALLYIIYTSVLTVFHSFSFNKIDQNLISLPDYEDFPIIFFLRFLLNYCVQGYNLYGSKFLVFLINTVFMYLISTKVHDDVLPTSFSIFCDFSRFSFIQKRKPEKKSYYKIIISN